MTTKLIDKWRKEFLQRMENENKNKLEKYLTIEKDKINVNWELIAEEESNPRKQREIEDILAYLRYKGVLKSQRDKESFFLFGCGMNLGPMEGLITHNFARIEDAKKYCEAKYNNAYYEVEVLSNENYQ